MDPELAFAVVTAAATSVSFAAAWAVGVMVIELWFYVPLDSK